ncbi:PhzF family phenazine biosynthesis protein [Cellulomonas chengniuliangii]|uniref:PhzF family phenazine biosynthesis protein n=1 Tax=Cellulomonas chengniuliangii TaxID=2968084 RepID=A0ABY5KVW7_9CELL|nr:PhzF family phenazine biosynthesis protein [Cellulomonas chengniuliangii]MCC2308906.1 PhzF family phenazine biosynthesis protein [Cellulomonas chengniuliangii]UUI74354.1 PhzF family phenazine biosynthesis protein [Cellulomonas chengniuliangii]
MPLAAGRPFAQVDVFTDRPFLGNPVAVVLDGRGLDDAQMAAFARWTNLSETTFVLPAADPAADYRLRIFTPGGELPFAGHPTLGSCHAWLAGGGMPRQDGVVVQECGAGLVRIRRTGTRLWFAAPPLLRTGPLDDETLERATASLAVRPEQVRGHQWLDNGPGWAGLLLDSAQTVLDVRADSAAMGGTPFGVIGPHPAGSDVDFEVRAFIPDMGVTEDPVTGSLNAGLGQWLIGEGLAAPSYVARQGTALQRDGRVHVQHDGRDVWVGGDCESRVEGVVRI